MKKPALIVVNGELPGAALLNKLASETDQVICTDGAAQDLRKHGIVADIIIGDLDSLDPEARKIFAIESRIIEQPSQYSTDFEKALELASELGYKELFLVGVKGGRFDHTFTNISILHNYVKRFDIQIFDDDGYGVLLHAGRPSYKASPPVGSTVSLLALDQVTNITTSGLLYPLAGETLEFGGRSGQSNQTVAEDLEVFVGRGTLMVYVLNK